MQPVSMEVALVVLVMHIFEAVPAFFVKKNNRPSMLCVKKLTLKKAEASSVMESLD